MTVSSLYRFYEIHIPVIFQTSERSPYCPKYDLSAAKTPNRGAAVAQYPGYTSIPLFRVEPIPSEPGPSPPIVHYSRIQFGNITNGRWLTIGPVMGH